MANTGERSSGRNDTSDSNGSTLCCWSCRCMVAILACISLMNMYAQQTAMSVSLGCMINSSLLVHQVISLESAQFGPDVCDHLIPIRELSDRNTSSSRSNLQSRHPYNIKIPGSFTWDRSSQNLIVGSFAWGYLFSLSVSGLLAFKSSGRKLLGYSHLMMSLSTLMTPVASLYMHTYAVVGLQFIAGLGAGTTYPSIMAIWRRWAPPGERCRLFAVTYCGIPLGIMISTSTIQVSCYYTAGSGWSALFYALGLLGMVWFVLWMTLVSSCPEKSRRISEAEKLYISKSLASHDGFTGECDHIPLKSVCCSRVVWSLIPIHVSTEWGLQILFYSMPVYLKDVLGLDVNRFFNGYFSTAPFAAFLCVLLVFGVLADCLTSYHACQVKVVRKLYVMIGTFALSVGLVFLTLMDCERWLYLMVTLTATIGLHAVQYCSSMVVPMDTCPKYSPLITGLSLTVAHIFRLVGTYLVNFFSSEGGHAEWQGMLYTSAVISLVSGVIFLTFGGGKMDVRKSETLNAAFASEEHSSAAVAEQGSSRSADETCASTLQETNITYRKASSASASYGQPICLYDWSDQREDRNVRPKAGNQSTSNDSSVFENDRRRKTMPKVSIV